jgi:hypothetical protein
MSALGHKRTCAPQKVMCALHPKADMCGATAYVCFGPIADIEVTLTLISFTTQSIFCGALPWPATLNLGFQRETKEGSDQHNST